MSATEAKDFPLGIVGFQFSDLYSPERLKELHDEFWKTTEASAPGLRAKLDTVGNGTLTPPQESEILIEVSKATGEFIARLFNVTGHVAKIRTTTAETQPIFRFKKDFLNVRVFKRLEEAPITDAEFAATRDSVQTMLSHEPFAVADEELHLASITLFLLGCEKKLKSAELDATENVRVRNLCSHFYGSTANEKVELALKAIEDWCVQTWVSPSRRVKIANWVSFIRPKKLEFEHLVDVEHPSSVFPELMQSPSHHLRPRDGFKLTDPRLDNRHILREIDYCIYCHQRQKDSCSHGFPEKDGTFKRNPLGIALKGCPLDERISEMHWLRKNGELIAALSMIMLDNPMCPGTGHRICNDCMKGCIFQKQDPVNIPANETAVLSEVLNLPYGFEIYSLLTRFNPVNRQIPFARPYNGNNVLIVGLGPAGYTLAHHLANLGFGVVGIDALKLEPVDAILTGKGKPFAKPIQQYSELNRELDERIVAGFGGVSEYGITVRWDKNFLNVIYLSLLRRQNVEFYGGIRFGGTLSLDDAWELGFHHVALATGAGKPTLIDMKNNLIRGIRKASDFLMALQLTGAFKKNSLANLQVRLPAIVVGGGLTAVDTATELFAYYPVQVEKTLDSFETLCRELGEARVWQTVTEEEKAILEEFLEHGKIIREERKRAEKERRKPNFIPYIQEWGGVRLAYRKRMIDSPAYRLNHEEVAKALEEGIGFMENLVPVEAISDKYGAVEAVVMKRATGDLITVPARSVCVAAGTSPNTIYEREWPGTFEFDRRNQYFQTHRAVKNAEGSWELQKVDNQRGAFFTSYNKGGRLVSFYGDNHPDYAGNVVKAMASAKHGAPEIARLFEGDIRLAEKTPAAFDRYRELVKKLDGLLSSEVVKVVRLTPTIVEVIVKSPLATRKFEPGQFYRFQNFESYAPTCDGKRLTMEGLALTGAWADKENDLLSLIVLEMGTSSRLCSLLKPGDPVVVMGPTGTPSEIPRGETVALIGGGLGNAVHLSIARALKDNGCKVLYFAGYRQAHDLFKQDLIESVTDQVIWAVDRGEKLPVHRQNDRAFVGNIVEAMHAYATGQLQNPPLIPLSDVDRFIVIGSDRMMEAVAKARHGILKPYLKAGHVAIGSINSPMQCMMKEVCAQCLQRHVDPVTGTESFVFSCYNQDQAMDQVDWKHLNDRLRMNSLAEKLSDLSVARLFTESSLERV